MQVLNSFTLPEEPPVVPQRLADRITDWLPGATKIDIQLASRGGWKVVNSILLDGDEEPSEVYSMVKACGDQHAMEMGEAAKYRAQVWRGGSGRNGVRRRVNFNVLSPYDDEDDLEDTGAAAEEIERQLLRSRWRELYDAQQDFIKFAAEFNHRSHDRVLDASKQVGETIEPLVETIHELVGPYREGLRMQAHAVREIGDMRVKAKLAEAKIDDGSKFWDTFGPAVKVALGQASQKIMGSGPKPLPAAGNKPKARDAAVSRRQATAQPATAPDAKTSARPEQPTATASPPAESTVPSTLQGIASALIDGMGSDTLVRVVRTLDDDQAEHFQAVSAARDDDTAAEAVVTLMNSLMQKPTTLMSMQQLLGHEHISAFQQVAMLAQRHLDERAAVTVQGSAENGGEDRT